MKKDRIELRPCPFCGAENNGKDIRLITDYDLHKHPSSLVTCVKCGVSTKRFIIDYIFFEISRQEAGDRAKLQAVDAWNNRTQNASGQNQCDYCKNCAHQDSRKYYTHPCPSCIHGNKNYFELAEGYEPPP